MVQLLRPRLFRSFASTKKRETFPHSHWLNRNEIYVFSPLYYSYSNYRIWNAYVQIYREETEYVQKKKLKTEVDWNMDCWIISIECWRRSECIENDGNNVGFSGGSHAWMRLWQVARFAWKNWFFRRSKKEQAMGFEWNYWNEMWTNLYGKMTADLILLRRRTIKQLERNHQDIKISPIITFWGNRYSININLRHWNFLCIVGKSSNFVLESCLR